MEIQQLKNIIEAALMASGSALSVERLQLLFEEHEKPDSKLIKEALQALAEDMEGRGIEVKEVASGFRLQVKKDVAPWVSRLWEEKPPRYTRALLETLSLIAYRQPITRGDIEGVRVVGHRDVPGRPAMYATTKTFLDYFNLKNLDELPSLDEIREMDDANQKLESINAEKRASATREYDFTSEEDVEARGEEVLSETEQDIIEAEKLIDQVEENVFNKPEEEEEPEVAEDVASETAQPSFAEMAAKLGGESGGDEISEQADSLSSVASLAEKTEQRLASDIIADHQARQRGEIVDEPEESEPQPEAQATAVDTEQDERSSLLAEQERLMQQLMQQEAERQAQAAMSEAGMSESISSEEPEDIESAEPEQESVFAAPISMPEPETEQAETQSEEDDEMARMEAEAAAELAMLEEEQAERELLEAERLAREELEAEALEKEQNAQQKPANPDSLFSD